VSEWSGAATSSWRPSSHRQKVRLAEAAKGQPMAHRQLCTFPEHAEGCCSPASPCLQLGPHAAAPGVGAPPGGRCRETTEVCAGICSWAPCANQGCQLSAPTALLAHNALLAPIALLAPNAKSIGVPLDVSPGCLRKLFSERLGRFSHSLHFSLSVLLTPVFPCVCWRCLSAGLSGKAQGRVHERKLLAGLLVRPGQAPPAAPRQPPGQLRACPATSEQLPVGSVLEVVIEPAASPHVPESTGTFTPLPGMKSCSSSTQNWWAMPGTPWPCAIVGPTRAAASLRPRGGVQRCPSSSSAGNSQWHGGHAPPGQGQGVPVTKPGPLSPGLYGPGAPSRRPCQYTTTASARNTWADVLTSTLLISHSVQSSILWRLRSLPHLVHTGPHSALLRLSFRQEPP